MLAFSVLAAAIMAAEDVFVDLPAFDESASVLAANRRAMCEGCGKPSKVCLCDVLPKPQLETVGNILILQHPDEVSEKNAKSTVNLVQRSLRKCQVVVGRKFRRTDLPSVVLRAADQAGDAKAGVQGASTADWRRTLLMWPGDDAAVVDAALAAEVFDQQNSGEGGGEAEEGKYTLVLLDGTWPSCQQMLHKSDALKSLRCVRITPTEEGRYALRIQPGPDCRSTLEAAAEAVAVLEKEHGGEEARAVLFKVLDRMVSLQCSFIVKPRHRPDAPHYVPDRYQAKPGGKAGAARGADRKSVV